MTKIKEYSCGGILHTIINGIPGVILGLEKGLWLPFKGRQEPNETFEQTAIREIYEELCGVWKPSKIDLKFTMETKNKTYLLGSCYIDKSILEKFNTALKTENRLTFKEKTNINFFPLNKVLKSNIHHISKKCIEYYYDDIKKFYETFKTDQNDKQLLVIKKPCRVIYVDENIIENIKSEIKKNFKDIFIQNSLNFSLIYNK